MIHQENRDVFQIYILPNYKVHWRSSANVLKNFLFFFFKGIFWMISGSALPFWNDPHTFFSVSPTYSLCLGTKSTIIPREDRDGWTGRAARVTFIYYPLQITDYILKMYFKKLTTQWSGNKWRHGWIIASGWWLSWAKTANTNMK